MENNWKVTFERNGSEGERIAIEKKFRWGNYGVFIPAIYLFEEGLVFDICLEADKEKTAAFIEKWKETLVRSPTEQERRSIEAENPLMLRYSRRLWVNGVELKRANGHGSSHIPTDILPENLRRGEKLAFVEGLGLDEDHVWAWMQMRYFWEGEKPEKIESIDLELRQDPFDCLAESFVMPSVGESVTLTHPKNGGVHTLKVTDIRREQVKLPSNPDTVYPENVVVMAYETEPKLSRKEFYLADAEENDKPKKLSKNGSSGGTFGMILRNPENCAVSSAHFEPKDTVTWQAVFLEKDMEDRKVKLV